MRVLAWRRTVALSSVLATTLALAGLGAVPLGLPARAAEPVVMTVTGDIDGCERGEETAGLVANIPGPIATVGDHAYPEATADALARCYEPTWGRFKDRTHPVPGNHDYDVSKAEAYFEYFGAAAGELGRGWYSYDVGSWHVVALNSNCDEVDCEDQSEWLQNDLRAHPSRCIMAHWHHPRFSSGTSGGDSAVGAFWKVLYEHGATLVFNGHDHNYERFAPQDPSGHRDPDRGIRQFIVGTGGAGLGSLAGAAPNSEVRDNRAYGVLQLTLRADGYDWRFVSVDGDDFTDTGSDTCRGTAASAAPPTTLAPAPPEEPPVAAPATTAPAPAAPAPKDPPITGRRPRNPASPPPPRTARPQAAARPAPIAAAPSPSPEAEPPPAPTTTTPVSVTPTPPAPDSAMSAPEPAGTAADSASLALAISGLIETPAPPRPTDRRGITLVAIGLMAADCVAIGRLRRRGRRVLSR